MTPCLPYEQEVLAIGFLNRLQLLGDIDELLEPLLYLCVPKAGRGGGAVGVVLVVAGSKQSACA